MENVPIKNIILEVLNLFGMKNYERIILNKNKKDIGLRENNRGAIYIKPRIYFKNTKVKEQIERLSKSNIVKFN